MKYVVTGAYGFLGYHTRCRLLFEPDAEVIPIHRGNWSPDALDAAVADADVVLHLAGINRGPGSDLLGGNIRLARDLVESLTRTDSRAHVVYAGSNYADEDHPGRDSDYGRGKRAAASTLLRWACDAETSVTDVRFCGLFGEHGRPDYNSFVATFAARVAEGEAPVIQGDRELTLLHVGQAVEVLCHAARARTHGVVRPAGHPRLISDIAHRLQELHDVYASAGDLPALDDRFDVALFNTLRAQMWPVSHPFYPPVRHDARGGLVETVRSRGGGQGFFSTTRPGAVRGEHVHFAKFERFQVVSGRGLIRLRRMFTRQIVEFAVSGEVPAIVDMPTLWTHSIENVGDTELVTAFWTNELLDRGSPDTYPLPVQSGRDRPTTTGEPMTATLGAASHRDRDSPAEHVTPREARR